MFNGPSGFEGTGGPLLLLDLLELFTKTDSKETLPKRSPDIEDSRDTSTKCQIFTDQCQEVSAIESRM